MSIPTWERKYPAFTHQTVDAGRTRTHVYHLWDHDTMFPGGARLSRPVCNQTAEQQLSSVRERVDFGMIHLHLPLRMIPGTCHEQ